MASIYERIIALFNENHVKYTEAEHHQEGHGTHVAQFHGLDETCGAKAIVVNITRCARALQPSTHLHRYLLSYYQPQRTDKKQSVIVEMEIPIYYI